MARVYLVSESEMRSLFARLSVARLHEQAGPESVYRTLRADVEAWAREIGFAPLPASVSLLSEVAAARFRPRAFAPEDDDFGEAPCDSEAPRQ